jgi:hypothetical protein
MKKIIVNFLVIVALVSCNKQSENLSVIDSKDLMPLAVGKTFIYRLDSTKSAPFGGGLTETSYIIKDSVESSFLDATNHQSFRIYRYITDTLQSKPFVPLATMYATIVGNNYEVVEDNFRFIKLANPITESNSWKGNLYINTSQSSNYNYMDGWNYQYQKLDQPFTCLKGTIKNTYTVFHINYQQPLVFTPSQRNDKNYSIEVYAKGVGLIYKEFIHWVYQPNQNKYEDDAIGIKLNLIEAR